jgi:LysM repeat protein
LKNFSGFHVCCGALMRSRSHPWLLCGRRLFSLAGMTFPAGRILFCFFILLFGVGCFRMTEGTLNEEKDPHFMEGKKKVNSMDYDGAIESFERALQANPRSAAAHFELGVLYEERKHDFGSALYHYQRHLQLNPKAPMADVIAGRITECKRQLAKTVSVALVSREIQRDLERLTLTNNALRERMIALEAELNRRPQFITNFVTNWLTTTQFVTRTIEAPAPVTPNNTPVPAPVGNTSSPRLTTTPRNSSGSSRTATPVNRTAAPAGNPAKRVHIVRSGDTLAKLSRQYNVSMDALRRANPGISPNRITAGQSIVIPAR